MKNRIKKMATDLTQRDPRHDRPHQRTEVTGWFRRRKKAEERLLAFTGGTIEFAHNGFYRGTHHRHWLRHTCGCHFLASEAEVARLGRDACTYCGVRHVEDLKRFGSTQAVQELVAIMTGGNLEFCTENRLGRAEDRYTFYCHVHREEVSCTFTEFIAKPDEVCVDCFFDALKRRPTTGRI